MWSARASGTIAAGIVFFSRTVRRKLVFALPFVRRVRLETPARAVYDGVHGYRNYPGTLLLVSLLSGSIPGIAIGSHIASRVPDRVLRPLMAGTLALVGGRLVF